MSAAIIPPNPIAAIILPGLKRLESIEKKLLPAFPTILKIPFMPLPTVCPTMLKALVIGVGICSPRLLSGVVIALPRFLNGVAIALPLRRMVCLPRPS